MKNIFNVGAMKRSKRWAMMLKRTGSLYSHHQDINFRDRMLEDLEPVMADFCLFGRKGVFICCLACGEPAPVCDGVVCIACRSGCPGGPLHFAAIERLEVAKYSRSFWHEARVYK